MIIDDTQAFKRALRLCTAIATSDAAERPDVYEKLYGVVVADVADKTLRLSAADGHRAVRVTLTGNDGLTTRRYLDVSAIDALEGVTSLRNGADGPASISFVADETLVQASFVSEQVEKLSCWLRESKAAFPYDELSAKFALLKREPPKLLASLAWEFNPHLLFDFATVAAKLHGDSPKARAWVHWPVEESDPIGFSTYTPTCAIEYLLMPYAPRPYTSPRRTSVRHT